jgi:hypothetical protein
MDQDSIGRSTQLATSHQGIARRSGMLRCTAECRLGAQRDLAQNTCDGGLSTWAPPLGYLALGMTHVGV